MQFEKQQFMFSACPTRNTNQMLEFPQAMVSPNDNQDKLVGDPLCSFQNGKIK